MRIGLLSNMTSILVKKMDLLRQGTGQKISMKISSGIEGS